MLIEMLNNQRKVVFVLMFAVTLLTSCVNGLEPLPDKVGDLDLSLSIPLAKADVSLSKTYHVGLPNWFLNQNVPAWAKYDYIYYADTVAVDLYRIFEHNNTVTYLAFSINVWNEFPVKGTLTIHFADKIGNVLYSFEPIEIEYGHILFNGNIVKPGFSRATVAFDAAKIESIRAAEVLVYKMKINLKDANINSFQYFDQFKMDCHLGARIDFVLKDI